MRVNNIAYRLSMEAKILTYSQFLLWINYYLVNPFFSLYFVNNGLSSDLLGVILGARTVSFSVGMIIGGAISDIYNTRKITTYTLFISSILYLVLSTTNIHYFTFIFILIGLFGGIAFSSESKLIVMYSSKDNRLTVFSIMRTVITLSSIVYPILLYKVFADNYYSFIYFSAVTYLSYSILLMLILKNHRHVTNMKISPENVAKSIFSYIYVLKNKNFLATFAVICLSFTSCYFIETTLPLYLKNQSDHYAFYYSLVISISAYSAIGFQLFIFPFIKKINSKILFFIGNLLLLFGFSILFGLSKQYLIGLIIIVLGRVLLTPSALVMLVDHAEPDHYAKYLTISNLRLPMAQSLSSILGFFIASKYGADNMILLYITMSVATIFSMIFVYL